MSMIWPIKKFCLKIFSARRDAFMHNARDSHIKSIQIHGDRVALPI